jgi:hypothetical protein
MAAVWPLSPEVVLPELQPASASPVHSAVAQAALIER